VVFHVLFLASHHARVGAGLAPALFCGRFVVLGDRKGRPYANAGFQPAFVFLPVGDDAYAPRRSFMTKPLISIVGSPGNYQSGNRPALIKIIWSGMDFTAPVTERLEGAAMPIGASGNAARAFSFINRAAAGAQFRVALADYVCNDGCPGGSRYWFYDPTGIGWSRKNYYDTMPNSLPFNTGALSNIEHGGNYYLAAADYDSADNNGGTLRLISLTADDAYATAASLTIPNKTVDGNAFQARVQDVYVDGNRIFALVIYYDDCLNYLKSEVREYQLTGFGHVTFSLTGIVETGKNAAGFVPYTSGNSRYLFIPCVGGTRKAGGDNGADSYLGMIDVTSDINPATVEKKAYVGGTYPAFRDILGLAIATNGTAYILTGGYVFKNGNPAMSWTLYQTTVTDLAALVNVGNTGVIPATLGIAGGTHYNAFFWAIGICSNGKDEYLVFGKGSAESASPVARDELRFMKVGAAWSSVTPGDNFVITADTLNGGSDATQGFALSSMDISAPGVCPKTARHHVHTDFIRAMLTSDE